MALTNLASPVNYNVTPVDFSPIAKAGLAYAQGQRRQEQQAQRQDTVAQAQDLFRAGDMDAIGEFAIANPELGKAMFEMGGIRDEAAQKRMTGLSKQLAMSSFPVRDLKAHIAQGEAAGRDMSHSKNLLADSGGDPAQLKKISEMGWAASDPKTYKSYRSSLPEVEKPMTAYQSATIEGKKADQALRKEELDIKRMNARRDKETDELKKEKISNEIKFKEEQVAKKKKESIEKAEDNISKIQQASDTIGRLLEGDALEASAGWQANLPTLAGTDPAGFEATLETLQSQAFLSQIGQMKGMGALSEGEGRKLAQAIGSLSIDMSDKKLRSELNRINEMFQSSISKARSRMPKSQGLASDTATLSDDDLLKKYGG